MNRLRSVCQKCGKSKYRDSFNVYKRGELYQVSYCFLELAYPLDYNAAFELFPTDLLRKLNNSLVNSTTIPNESSICDWFFNQELTCFGSCPFLVEISVFGNVNYDPMRNPFSWR